MATRKEAKQKSFMQILGLLVVVMLVVAAVVLGQMWLSSRPAPEPEDVAVTASVGDRSIEVSPYMVCAPGEECEEGEVPVLEVGADESLTITVPEPIYDHDWQLLTIYDDPGANDQQVHGPHDTDSVEIPGSAEPVGDSDERTRLVVVEVSSVMIGHDEDGVETPYTTVWSISTQAAE